MCWFGSETKKPMVMYTNAKWIEDIELFQMFEWSKKKTAEHLAMQKPNNEGKLCYYGKPRMLQQSGMYMKQCLESPWPSYSAVTAKNGPRQWVQSRSFVPARSARQRKSS